MFVNVSVYEYRDGCACAFVNACMLDGRDSCARVYVGLWEAGRLIMKQAGAESSLQGDP